MRFFFLDFEPFSLCDSYLPEREGKRPALGLVFFLIRAPVSRSQEGECASAEAERN